MNKRTQSLMPNGTPKYIRVYDNGGESADRYTVVFTGRYRKPMGTKGGLAWFQYIGMSADPFQPQGVGQHGESPIQIDVNRSGFAPAMGRKNHLGTRIPFSKLPHDCKRLVWSDYKEIWGL